MLLPKPLPTQTITILLPLIMKTITTITITGFGSITGANTSSPQSNQTSDSTSADPGSDSNSDSPTQQPINFFYMPGVVEGSYRHDGDVIIGALANSLTNTGTPGLTCSNKTYRLSYTADTTEAIAFAVDLINRNKNLLPNVTLGFVVRGVCSASPNVALATSLSFIPRSKRVCSSGDMNYNAIEKSGGVNGSDDTSYNENSDSKSCESTQVLTSPSDSEWLNDDVIGVVSPDRDDLTAMVSSLFSVAQLPVIGTSEVGDDLSDKQDHPYFFRVSPPSRYQIKAILKFLSSNSWSYVSVVYQEGAYGENAYDTLIRMVDGYRICIATSHMVLPSSDYDAVVADLLEYPRARVVVFFGFGSRLRQMLRGVKNNNASGHFIFVAGDLVALYSGYKYVGTADDPAIGIFVFDLYFTYVMEFYEFLQQQQVATTKNPWLRGAFEYIMECSYDTNQTRRRICNPDKDIYETYRYRTNKATSMRIDAVLTLAHAVHNLLEENCPGVVGKDARDCITGPLMHEYLKKVSFEGYNGRIEFDENHDVKGKYVIGQFVYDYHQYPFTTYRRFKHMVRKNVGVYDSLTDTISYYDNEPITWSHVNTLERVIPWTNHSSPSSLSSSSSSSTPFIPSSPPSPEIPESVCSRPCTVGEYKIEKDVPCCWECRRCRDNERLINGNTSCQACPSFTWPDPGSGFTQCVDIPPTYPAFDDIIPITLTIIALLCLIFAVVISITYIIYRQHRVIKASSRELSLIQLVAILAGYVTVVLYQTTPTDVMCSAIFFMFCMSFALLYCPLLVKTIRIVRIFQSGAKNEKPRFIDSQSQLVFAISLIAVQAALCASIYILYRPQSRLTQPIWTERYVEMSCDITFMGMACFLAYNIIQVFLCSVFAFKVRKLPDNFNESKFISMCVSTTLLIWLAFIPTYFTADREYIRTFLLSTALIMNHSVALVFLFMPKIYAAKFLESDSGNFANKRT